MRGNVETIKFTGFFCTVLAILTYIITLNIEIGFFHPNWCWISNNFALTVCGGGFASFLVVMLCEVQKYRSNKLSCENFLYSQGTLLYSTLYFMYKNIDEYIENQNRLVPGNLLDEKMLMIRNQTMAVRSVDYVTVCKNNKLVNRHKKFCLNGLVKAEAIIGSQNYLKSAIIQTQMENLKDVHNQGEITSSEKLVSEVLTALKVKILPVLEEISDYLGAIDKNCSLRYGWEQQKIKVHQSYISLFELEGFEEFFKEAKK